MIKLKCIKTFIKTYINVLYCVLENEDYEIKSITKSLITILDSKSQELSFYRIKLNYPYENASIFFEDYFEDYFDPNPVNIRFVIFEKSNKIFNIKL